MRRSSKILVLVTLSAIAVYSCAKHRLPTGIASRSSADPLVSLLIQGGYPADKIVDRGSYFVIDGDMIVRKSDIRFSAPRPTKSTRHRASPTGSLQMRYEWIVSDEKISSVTVLVDASVATYSARVQDAVDAWNAIDTNVHFTVVTSGTPDVTIYSGTASNCPSALATELNNGTDGACACAFTPANALGLPGSAIALKTSLIQGYSTGAQQSVIMHELGHTLGLLHPNSTAAVDSIQIDHTPSGDNSSIMFPSCGAVLSIDDNDKDACRLLWPDGTVSVGTSDDLDATYSPYGFTVPGTVGTTPHLIKMDMAGSNSHVYAWYDNGTASSGTEINLTKYAAPYSYTLPTGYSSSDIVGIAIAASNDHVYAWYRNGYASSGTSSDFGAYASPFAYTLPTGYSVDDIIDMAINSQDRVYTWYTDGKCSIGNSGNLAYYTAPFTFTPATGKTAAGIAALAIAHSPDRVYAWYRDYIALSGVDILGAPSGPILPGTAETVTAGLTPSNAQIRTYSWTIKKSGATQATGSGSSISYTYSTTGSYTIDLSATDYLGNTRNASQQSFNVWDSPVITATAVINGHPAVLDDGASVNANVTVTATNYTSLTATRNGTSYSWPSGGVFSTSGTYVITAVGSTTETFTFTRQ